jgi:hypothetical protein
MEELLPGEVVLHVFSFLGPFDLLALQATSRSLQHFALDHALWRDLIRRRWHSPGSGLGDATKDEATQPTPFDRFWLRFRWLESEMNVEESESSSGRRTRPKRTELVGHQDQINSCTLEKTNHTLLVTSSRDLTVRVRVLSPLPRPAWPDTTELRHGRACVHRCGISWRASRCTSWRDTLTLCTTPASLRSKARRRG